MNTIVTFYSKRQDNGYLAYAGPRSYGAVKDEMLKVMSTIKDRWDSTADNLYEWMQPEAANWFDDFPFGDVWVTYHTGNCEGYIIRVLVRDVSGRKAVIRPCIAIKFLSDRDMVERTTNALSRAFDEGLFDSRIL